MEKNQSHEFCFLLRHNGTSITLQRQISFLFQWHLTIINWKDSRKNEELTLGVGVGGHGVGGERTSTMRGKVVRATFVHWSRYQSAAT